MYHETMQKLENLTDHVEFERMMCDILSSHGYKGIDPQSPGLADGGKDALFFSEDGNKCFAFSLRKDWKKKFHSDFKQAQESGDIFVEFIFCTNRRLPVLERDKIKAKYLKKKIDFWDQERLRVALDTHDKKIRQIYLGIEDNTQTRNRIKNILFDPNNETLSLPRWNMLPMLVPREACGIFDLLKDLDLTVICEDQEEFKIFTDFLRSFRIIRKSASEIDDYIFRVIDQNISNKFVGHWQNISEYCKLRFRGLTRELAVNRLKTSNVQSGVSDFDSIHEILLHDNKLKTLSNKLTKDHEVLMSILDKIKDLETLKLS